jgi:hypothetical protein
VQARHRLGAGLRLGTGSAPGGDCRLFDRRRAAGASASGAAPDVRRRRVPARRPEAPAAPSHVASGAAGGAAGSAGGAAGLALLTRRGGGSAGAAGFGGFAAPCRRLPPLRRRRVSANEAFDGTVRLRCRARRETNSRATTSSMVLEALLTSMP